jgi:hypothetical protein
MCLLCPTGRAILGHSELSVSSIQVWVNAWVKACQISLKNKKSQNFSLTTFVAYIIYRT